MKLYHGTSISGLSVLLPPDVTGNQREARKVNTNFVFATTNYDTALRYAQDCVKRFGGVVTVYEVEGEFVPWKNVENCSIWIAPQAFVRS